MNSQNEIEMRNSQRDKSRMFMCIVVFACILQCVYNKIYVENETNPDGFKLRAKIEKKKKTHNSHSHLRQQ